ncbi:apolipoprotein N-acyltransferase [Prosthecobacter sp.]|uniref:apolipoprotein N-acyltransferase n=1 Tax=Prosthecobacter sp. TaxID=1965333 RepID=UPI0037834BDB
MTDTKRLRLFMFIAPLLSGIILTFAFPGWNSNLAVWLWLLPLLAVLWSWKNAEGVKVRPFWRGYLAGLAFFLINLKWVHHSARVRLGNAIDDSWSGLLPELAGFGALVGLAGYCAVYFGLWAWFTHRFARPNVTTLTKDAWWPSTLHSLTCSFLAASAWVACEWLRSTTVFTGFGWNGLGVAMYGMLPLIQAADLVGVFGLSFLPVFVACTAWNTLTRLILAYRGEGTCKTRLDFTVALILMLSTAAYGMLKLTAKEADAITVRTVLVQPNVSLVDAATGRLAEQTYQHLDQFTRMYGTAKEGKTSTDLIIWPESALPVNLEDRYHYLPQGFHQNYFNDMLQSGDFSLFFGTDLYESAEIGHVSAVLFRGSAERRQEYHKVHLVPFGEYLPLKRIPPFSLFQSLFEGAFTPGVKTEPLKLEKPEVQIIPLICFEDTVGRLARRFVREAPQMIVNITNDGWFLQSEEPEVHMINSLFRAIELRRPMVRATNTGVSCFIDTCGRITSRLKDPETGSSFIEGTLPGEVKVPRSGHMTLYARFGDWFALTLLGVCVAAWIYCGLIRKKNALP